MQSLQWQGLSRNNTIKDGSMKVELNMFTKLEKKVLLEFAKANMDCDIDSVRSGDGLPKHFKSKTEAEVKKVWKQIIKKLKG